MIFSSAVSQSVIWFHWIYQHMFLPQTLPVLRSSVYALWAASEKVDCIAQDSCVCVWRKFCLYPYLSLGIPSIPSTQGEVNSVLASVGPCKWPSKTFQNIYPDLTDWPSNQPSTFSDEYSCAFSGEGTVSLQFANLSWPENELSDDHHLCVRMFSKTRLQFLLLIT